MFILGCASPAAPPGGPIDIATPQLVRVSPDSGQVRAFARGGEVVFEFDEVVSELPRGGSSLRDIVLVSPSDGPPVVEWHRKSITIRPRRGWRPNTTYVVTLLPGVADLAANARDSSNVVVFSTGDSIPRTRIAGVIFDWLKATPAPGAYIEARLARDTLLTFAAQSDSVGRFAFPFLTPDVYHVRAVIDGNRNRKLDEREAYDSSTVTLRDTASVEFYAFVHDSFPNISSSTATVDSLTLKIAFDKPLSPVPGYLPEIRVTTLDSVPVPIARIQPWPAIAELRARATKAAADSVAEADTSTVKREARDQARRDAINRAAVIADSIARDTTKRVPPPVSKRPALITEYGVVFEAPLVPGTRYRIFAKAVGMLGAERSSVRSFELPKPPPPAKPPGTPPPPP